MSTSDLRATKTAFGTNNSTTFKVDNSLHNIYLVLCTNLMYMRILKGIWIISVNEAKNIARNIEKAMAHKNKMRKASETHKAQVKAI